MLQALDYGMPSPDSEVPEDAESPSDVASSLEFNITPAIPCTAHTHMMFPILAATSQEAFAQLQERLDSAERNASWGSYARHPDDPLSACIAAFEVLDNIRIGTFFSSNPPALVSPTKKARKPFKFKQAWLPRVAPWLRDYATKPAIPSPSEPLTRAFLSFLVQVPQSYLDLVMPLLEQRLETNATSPDDAPILLAPEHALALDIYAYWSVLMFLVEEESWWIGSLPVVTLTGMINKYGDEFVAGLRPEQDYGHDRWWPGIMLTVLRQSKRGTFVNKLSH